MYTYSNRKIAKKYRIAIQSVVDNGTVPAGSIIFTCVHPVDPATAELLAMITPGGIHWFRLCLDCRQSPGGKTFDGGRLKEDVEIGTVPVMAVNSGHGTLIGPKQ